MFITRCPRYTKDNIEKAIIVFLYTLIFCAIVYRLLHGIEITDEALYVAEGYIVTNGATPYVDMWFHASGFALLNAPFVWFYVFMTGSTAGIILYFRVIGLLIRLTIVMLACIIMKPHMKAKITALWLLTFVAFVPYSIITMSYGTWSLTLFLMASISLTHAVLSKNKKILFGIITGFFMALTILCYPTMIITGVILIGLIFTYEQFYHIGHKALSGYLIGGLTTAFVVILILSLRFGNISGLFEGLKIIMFDSPYHKLPKNITKESLSLMIGYIKNWIILISISYIFISVPIFNKKHRALIIIVCVIFSIFYYTINIFSNYALSMYAQDPEISSIICRLFFPIPLILFPLIDRNKKLALALLIFLYLPTLSYCLSSSALAFDGMNKRYYFLVQGTLLTIPFLFWAISDSAKRKLNNEISFFCSLLVACLFIYSFLLNYYGYMYRDEPMNQLDYKVKHGIYSGLYTTKSRGEGIISLEKTIRSETNSSEDILFMDSVPMAYLMTEAHHCAPSTWDIQFYMFGLTDGILLQKYFKTVKKTPDKIIYIFTGIDKILSIENEDYKFNNYVNRNYKLVSNTTDYYPVKIYLKNGTTKLSLPAIID